MRGAWLVGLGVLAAAPSAAAVKLSGPMVAGGDISNLYVFTSDGGRVLYTADQEVDGVQELYSAPRDGSAAAVKLNGPIVAGGNVVGVLTVPDGSRVVYQADQDDNDVFELYSRPADGSGAVVKLNGPMQPAGDVPTTGNGYRLTPDGLRVLYLADQDVDGQPQLYVVPVDGSAAPQQLTPTLGAGHLVDSTFPLGVTPDGQRVVFRASLATASVFEIWSMPTDGSAAPVRLNGALPPGGQCWNHRLAPNGQYVAYQCEQDVDNRIEIYRRAVDASDAPLKLSGTMVAGGNAVLGSGGGDFGMGITADSARVVYLADQEVVGRYELYSRRLDGVGTAVKLNGTLPVNGDVASSSSNTVPNVALSPDGSRVVYSADQDTDQRFELYSRAVDGSGAAVKLNQALPNGWQITRFLISADSARVAYEFGDTVFNLFSRALDGSGSPVQLDGGLLVGGLGLGFFRLTPDGAAVVFGFDGDVATVRELYRRALDGSGARVKLSGALVANGDVVAQPVIAPDGAVVLYKADQDSDEVFELYATAFNPPTPTPTATASQTSTATATATASPSATATATATETATAVPTATPSATATPTATATFTTTASATPTDTGTPTPLASPTATDTASVTPTETATATATPSATPTATVAGACPAAPRLDCRLAATSSFLLRGQGSGGRGKLIWKWLRGAATDAMAFGDPTTTALYTLCLYDGAGLRVTVQLPAGGAWRPSGDGFKYRDPDAAAAGLTQVLLRPGVAGRARVLVKGAGPLLAAPPLPWALPLTAQLANDGGACWTATFTAARRNDSGQVKARF